MRIRSKDDRWFTGCRGAGWFGAALGVVACVGCGSDSGNADTNGTGGMSGVSDDGNTSTGGSSDASGGDSTGAVEDECPHVVDTLGNPDIEPDDADVVATDGEGLFLLIEDDGLVESTTDHIIYELVGNAFEEVARVPYNLTEDHYSESGLAVTSDAIITDSAEGDVFSIASIPRDGGEAATLVEIQAVVGAETEPPFLSDADYLYFALAGEDSTDTYRIPYAGGDPELASSLSFFAGIFGRHGVSDSQLYYITGGIGAAFKLWTADLSTVPADAVLVNYILGTCETAPGKIILVDGHLYTACGSEGNTIGNVFRLDTLQTTGDEEVEGTLIYATDDLDYDTFIVRGDYLYYSFPDFDDEGGEGVYRVPLAGGEPELILPTNDLEQMLVIGSTLNVISGGCGLQRLPL